MHVSCCMLEGAPGVRNGGGVALVAPVELAKLSVPAVAHDILVRPLFLLVGAGSASRVALAAARCQLPRLLMWRAWTPPSASWQRYGMTAADATWCWQPRCCSRLMCWAASGCWHVLQAPADPAVAQSGREKIQLYRALPGPPCPPTWYTALPCAPHLPGRGLPEEQQQVCAARGQDAQRRAALWTPWYRQDAAR